MGCGVDVLARFPLYLLPSYTHPILLLLLFLIHPNQPSSSSSSVAYLGEVIAIAGHIGEEGQARIWVDPSVGVAQHVVDLLGGPLAPILF